MNSAEKGQAQNCGEASSGEAMDGTAAGNQGPAKSLLPLAPGALRVQHHLLLCATPSKPLCCDLAVGAASWNTLKRLVRELGLEDSARPQGVVWRTKADCLRVCGGGPILVIWPEGITYGGVTPERIERILLEHVIGGQPVEPWIVRRMTFTTCPPLPHPAG